MRSRRRRICRTRPSIWVMRTIRRDTGACEPLTVTPAPAPAIAIVKNPKSQTVADGWDGDVLDHGDEHGRTSRLTDVHVVDPLSPNCNRTKADIPALASMAPGAAVTYTCTRPNVQAGVRQRGDGDRDAADGPGRDGDGHGAGEDEGRWCRRRSSRRRSRRSSRTRNRRRPANQTPERCAKWSGPSGPLHFVPRSSAAGDERRTRGCRRRTAARSKPP